MSDFEKECSLEQSPGSFQPGLSKLLTFLYTKICCLDYKAADLSLVPVISDQLLREWAEGSSGFENANVGLLGKKALDLLCLKVAAEVSIRLLDFTLSSVAL